MWWRFSQTKPYQAHPKSHTFDSYRRTSIWCYWDVQIQDTRPDEQRGSNLFSKRMVFMFCLINSRAAAAHCQSVTSSAPCQTHVVHYLLSCLWGFISVIQGSGIVWGRVFDRRRFADHLKRHLGRTWYCAQVSAGRRFMKEFRILHFSASLCIIEYPQAWQIPLILTDEGTTAHLILFVAWKKNFPSRLRWALRIDAGCGVMVSPTRLFTPPWAPDHSDVLTRHLQINDLCQHEMMDQCHGGTEL